MEIAYIHRYWLGNIPNDLNASHESTCSCFLNLILKDYQIELVSPEQKGIYVATSNSGEMPSIEFWGAALKYGPGYAPPKNFPWTLANSPCSYFARMLNVQGPNFTLVGNMNAFIAALKHAEEDLFNDEILEAIIIGIDFGFNEEATTEFAAILLKRMESGISIIPIEEIHPDEELEKLNPSGILNLICQSIALEKEMIFGNSYEGFFKITYTSAAISY